MTIATGTASSMHEFSKPGRLSNRQFLSYIGNPQACSGFNQTLKLC